jgi:hypothetical protein
VNQLRPPLLVPGHRRAGWLATVCAQQSNWGSTGRRLG